MALKHIIMFFTHKSKLNSVVLWANGKILHCGLIDDAGKTMSLTKPEIYINTRNICIMRFSLQFSGFPLIRQADVVIAHNNKNLVKSTPQKRLDMLLNNIAITIA